MAESRTKDTLFIDMKYLILYRKLGYSEVLPDVLTHQYPDTSIIIESEEQRFQYLGKYYPLKRYHDFVLLECIDRLLKKGYASSDIEISGEGCDLLVKQNGLVLVKVFLAQWGKDYKALIESYKYDGDGVVCLYTSQLSGGLVDFSTKIYAEGMLYDRGIFERDIKPYNFKYGNKNQSGGYPKDFTIEDDEVLKYLGTERRVIVPDGIRRIGSGAFWNNLNIREVVLPESVTCICGDAFAYCENLVKANVPLNVDEIGDDPWAGCPDVEVDNRSPHYVIEDGVFFDKNKKFLIHYFINNERERYRVPESVEWIGKHSFYKSPYLKEVAVTKNVKFMGNNAFSDCPHITLKNESPYFNYIDGVLYNKDMTQLMHYSMGSGVKVVSIAESVRTIGRNSFWNCKMIDKVVIPASVRQIGYNPFANCVDIVFENHSPFYTVIDNILYDSSVKELVCCPSSAAKNGVNIPGSVLNIGRNAFTGCESLKKITIPPNVRFISRGAFSGCTNLEEVSIPDSVEEIGDWCFHNCVSLKKIRIPARIKLGSNTFNGCTVGVERY